MIRPLRRRLPKPHAAFAELLTAEEAQEYLPLSRTSEALVYFAVHGSGWDRGQGWPARRQRRRRPVAIVTWDPRAREVRGVTCFTYPFCVEYHSLLMVIERPQDLDDLVDSLHPFVDPRDRRVRLA
ncbi:MAG TPA: hypothetical protein VFF08_10695 [Trueperaceae bacterium]|nr:hypothetical protein [Trueperaceae bacterium]